MGLSSWIKDPFKKHKETIRNAAPGNHKHNVYKAMGWNDPAPTPAKPYQMSQAMMDRLGPEGLARMEANRQAAAQLRASMGYGQQQQAPAQQMMSRFAAARTGQGAGGAPAPVAQATPQAAVVNPRGAGGKAGGVRMMGYADGGKVITRKCNGKPK